MMKKKDEELTNLRKKAARDRKDGDKKSVSLVKTTTNPITLRRRAFVTGSSPFVSVRQMQNSGLAVKGDQTRGSLKDQPDASTISIQRQNKGISLQPPPFAKFKRGNL